METGLCSCFTSFVGCVTVHVVFLHCIVASVKCSLNPVVNTSIYHNYWPRSRDCIDVVVI